MKYNIKMYEYLSQYFEKQIEKNKNLGLQCDSFFEISNKLLVDKKISLNEHDLLCDSYTNLIDFVFKILSTCPDLFVSFGGGENE